MTSPVQNEIFVNHLYNFSQKSWKEKRGTILLYFKRMWDKVSFGLPLPVWLSFGGWFLTWNDHTDDSIFAGGYEEADVNFASSFLQEGMTVLDIGAHHGLYTILSSKKVGCRGRVISFEPSDRERKKLLWNLKLNLCKNVIVEDFALGANEGKKEFFIVKGKDTGCNSLHLPVVTEPVEVTYTSVVSLDNYLQQNNINQVDFIKMDAEGAELDTLKNSIKLLQSVGRPVILCEVADSRTDAWGYRGKEIIKYLSDLGYFWFSALVNKTLKSVSLEREFFDSNFIAIPKEKIEGIRKNYYLVDFKDD